METKTDNDRLSYEERMELLKSLEKQGPEREQLRQAFFKQSDNDSEGAKQLMIAYDECFKALALSGRRFTSRQEVMELIRLAELMPNAALQKILDKGRGPDGKVYL